MRNICKLDLSFNFQILNNSLQTKKNIYSLNLSNSPKITIEGLEALPYLKKLNLSSNTVVCNIGKLTQLVSLNLEKNEK